MTLQAHGFRITFINAGAYVGRDTVETVEDLPDAARLFSALVHSASTGPESVPDDRKGSAPGPDDLAALTWMEDHPPTHLYRPQTQLRTAVMSKGVVRSAPMLNHFRLTGLLTDRKSYQSVPKRYHGGHVVLGDMYIGWGSDDVPAEIRHRLTALAADIAHLGNTDSFVRITWDTFEATHAHDDTVSPFDSRTSAFPVATAGRIDELFARQVARMSLRAKRGSLTDGVGTAAHNAEKVRDPRTRVAMQTYRILQEDDVPAPGPWREALWFPIRDSEAARVTEDTRIGWAVAAHRAAVASCVGAEAITAITGRTYGPDRPANNATYQFIPDLRGPDWANVPDHAYGRGPGLLISLPDHLTAAETSELMRRLRLMRRRLFHKGAALNLGAPRVTDASTWWDAPPAGSQRVWLTYPLVVPEHSREESPSEVIRQGLRYVLPAPEKGAVRRSVRGATWLHGVNVQDYVHHYATERAKGVRGVRDGRELTRLPFHGVTATVDLAEFHELVGPRGLISIGQSRHLSGGLLIPVDTPDPEDIPCAP